MEPKPPKAASDRKEATPKAKPTVGARVASEQPRPPKAAEGKLEFAHGERPARLEACSWRNAHGRSMSSIEPVFFRAGSIGLAATALQAVLSLNEAFGLVCLERRRRSSVSASGA